MNKMDLAITPPDSGEVEFTPREAAEDSSRLLLQRLMTLMFADRDRTFSDDHSTQGLSDLLIGANQLDDSAMQSVLSLQCSMVLRMLDREDRDSIETFSAVASGGHVTCTVVMDDGTKISGDIK